MGITQDSNINDSVHLTGSKPQPEINISTKFNKQISDYFNYVYSYPPKIQIKWNNVDELNGDLFIRSNYGVLEHSLPFVDFINDWFFNGVSGQAVSENYELSEYTNGFLDKINSSNFFLKKTKEINNALSNIPIFLVLNGQGEIVLNKPSNNLNTNSPKDYFNEKLYDLCGAFDTSVEKKAELGLFFMNRGDAENYLKEIARSDLKGTQTVGLSVHCVNLSTAYNVTREYHPGVDFRFVPNFNEVKELLVNNIGKSSMITDDEQQQLRFRRRTHNLFPYLNKLGRYLSPGSSFLQRNEYFKGVPIYIVQVREKPRSFVAEQYFNFVGSLDTIYNSCIQYLDSTIGFGHNWIMQGSIQDTMHSDDIENYVFFERDQALDFSKKNGRKVVRFKGSRTSNLEFMVRKPKLFVYNLEDFLEDWEDKILEGISENKVEEIPGLFKTKATYFIPPKQNVDDVLDLGQDFQQTPLKKITQTVNVKLKVLKRTLGIFFSMN